MPMDFLSRCVYCESSIGLCSSGTIPGSEKKLSSIRVPFVELKRAMFKFQSLSENFPIINAGGTGL